MEPNYLLFGFLLVLSWNNVQSDSSVKSSGNSPPANANFPGLPADQLKKCNDVCGRNYEGEPIATTGAITTEAGACARGCRFFSIGHMLIEKTQYDRSITEQACNGCCDDSYVNNNRNTCRFGCEQMSSIITEEEKTKKALPQMEYQMPVVTQEVKIQLVIDVGSSEEETGPQHAAVDFEPDELMTDPALRQQLALNALVDSSRLPEVKVKTLPIESDSMESVSTSGRVQTTASCWWFVRDVVRMNHVPPCLLAAVLILICILLARLVFTCEIRKRIINPSYYTDNMSAEAYAKSVMSNPGKSNPVTVIVGTDSPSHKVPPPKYDDAVSQDEAVIIKKTPIM